MVPLLLLLVVAVTRTTATQDSLVVQTVQGKVRGSVLKTYTGKDVLSFRGVKYAETTGGENRFKPPVPVRPWDGVRDATKDGILCPQPFIDNTAADPEDCLSLNVYTKTLNGNQPVMVFIHHGGFMTGSGFSRIAGPQYLLDKDVVLVTLNYRLGALGFVHTEDGVLRGNNGMKDQVAALRWVKQNIARFGGNPEAVTLFGDSAGSASVMYHMISPMSRGLFVKAIAQSGAILGGWAINEDPQWLAYRLAELVGCQWINTTQVYKCLKYIPAQEIQNATLKIKDFGLDPFSNFAPVVEKDYGDGQERFVPQDPIQMLLENKFAQVPLLTGITRDEISFRADFLLRNPELTNQFNAEFERYFPVEFHYARMAANDSVKITRELKKFYFGDKPVSNETRDQLGKAYADAHLIFSGVRTAKILAEKSSKPVYFYQFDYEGRYSTFFYPGARTQPGVLHSDDLIYIFGNDLFLPIFNTTDPEAKVIRTMTSLWTTFAASGNPNGPHCSVNWPRLSKGNHKYLKISDNLKLVDGLPYPERMSVWERLFPIPGPRQAYF